jgi:hypothetical protein
MSIKSLIATSVVLAATASLPAAAAVIFQDSFDTDYSVSFITTSDKSINLINWTVSDGTVDYISSGDYGISCVGGTGGCLDLDGSTDNAGRITSKATYDLVAGVEYVLETMISGNQRASYAEQYPAANGPDGFVMGFINTANSSVVEQLTVGGLYPNDPFAPHILAFTPSSDGTYRLFVEGTGGDSFGVMLDNVVFRDNLAAIPEPTTLGLLGLGLLGLAAARRRKQ